eukprot:TRINITY_DN3329_c0_g1_i2.p1 TRINITY_DN3329_c0_g1~~TRINITY_DN3329_c0_g1_i2.p1  ORF type:complete len:274 (-),score=53.44 TRINITY_DN3329_c0_g1_i2:170-991(-)
MIHVFNCAKETCSLPGKVCEACGEACGKINCEPCRKGCAEVGKSVQFFFDRPLSTYVIIKLVLAVYMAYASAMAIQGMSGGKGDACKFAKSDSMADSVGYKNLLYGTLGFAIFHALFAPYMQVRVWQELKKRLAEGNTPAPNVITQLANQGVAGLCNCFAQTNPAAIVVPAETVHASFKEVFLHDFGVLFGAAVILASMLWCWFGGNWIANGTGCDPTGWAASAMSTGRMFFLIALIYNFCYYNCSCCASSVELKEDPALQGGYAQPGQQQMK